MTPLALKQFPHLVITTYPAKACFSLRMQNLHLLSKTSKHRNFQMFPIRVGVVLCIIMENYRFNHLRSSQKTIISLVAILLSKSTFPIEVRKARNLIRKPTVSSYPKRFNRRSQLLVLKQQTDSASTLTYSLAKVKAQNRKTSFRNRMDLSKETNIHLTRIIWQSSKIRKLLLLLR